MGIVVEDIETAVVTKTTGGVLCIPKGHSLFAKKQKRDELDIRLAKAVCCQCSMCSQMCPRNALGLNVLPHKAMRAAAYADKNLLGDYNGLFSCCDCGICTYYACNFGLKPSAIMQGMKKEFMGNSVKPKKEVYGDADKGFETKKLPTSRLIARLGLDEYNVPAPIGIEIDTDFVRIPLKMHIGAPCEPVVAIGESVQKGNLIAQPQGMGAKIHASITGTVRDANKDYIEIRE